jgi:hypothetical protein
LLYFDLNKISTEVRRGKATLNKMFKYEVKLFPFNSKRFMRSEILPHLLLTRCSSEVTSTHRLFSDGGRTPGAH